MNRILIQETTKNVGQTVKLAGWVDTRRDHGKLIFIDLRDMSGLLQVVFLPANKEVHDLAQKLRSEWVVEIEGIVKERPDNMVNKDLLFGHLEMEATGLVVLSEAQTPPFEVGASVSPDKKSETREELRMKYRYLDLRGARMRRNISLRYRVIKFIRDFLGGQGFMEIETPILTKSTPEGARDYIVPSRLQPGSFYALPQSPQQYKQLLQVAGYEKYFQIARCFRDEDTRGDRQPEFTQLDIETSFWSQEEILVLTEKLYIELLALIAPEKTITQTPFPRLTYKEAMEKYNSDKPDLRQDKNNPNEIAFAFIIDFPMFEWREEEKRFDAVHHPFTRPQSDDINFIKNNPADIPAYQYDLACNGYEIAGGSLRSYKPEVLGAVFEVMGHTKENIRAKFGHLLEAFEYGVPPHGGIAHGLDRFIAILAGAESIRDVIAFPKTGDGRDLMMAAPDTVEEAQLKELHIKIVK
ncbi:MAG: Aspartyl-tRNA synthetase [Parcubacteria group bacterium GW2011_GWC2_42_6]|nr:MAG: Aspartyl-tRNA synthetase [Parcubacteria group bacterium GW2011_GWA2_42_11]KKS68038.1 MAG: Aspartyl-tRNA synthetase [Parcubacteria group bacterium GW2011_GWC2_42_6]